MIELIKRLMRLILNLLRVCAHKKAAQVGGYVYALGLLCVGIIKPVRFKPHHLFTNVLVDLSHSCL